MMLLQDQLQPPPLSETMCLVRPHHLLPDSSPSLMTLVGPLLHPFPVVTVTPYNPNSFIVLASDGLWDVMTNKEVLQIFKDLVFPNGPAPASVLKELQKQLPKKAEESWHGKGRDDISVVIAQLCEKSNRTFN